MTDKVQKTAAYDRNGNLTSLTRTGARAETLAYSYTSGTNRLAKVTVGGVQKTYAYNADGTMSTDGLRGLSLTYNALKLPKQVKASSNTGTVDYIYDANGNKLAVKQGGTMKNVYCGDFVYNTSLAVDYILTPNGQLTRNPSTGAYTAQYNITDHLGNVRSVVNSGSTVLQNTDYYPFGLAFSDANITNNRYLYNGKELEDYTVGTSYLGTLDYGARHYDPRIARWTVPDPMAEKYYGYSSYTYCLDNPINLIDIKGNEPIRMFIGTADQFKELLDTSPNRVGGYTGQKAANYLRGLGSTDIKNGRPSPTETGFFNNKVGRYIYTYSGGWIDMAHFMFYAGMAFDNKLNKQEAKSLINSNFFKLLSPEDQIYWQIQSSIDPARKALRSGYLQECIDIITSPVSAFSYEDLPSDRFGADFGANYFDPNSPLSLGEQVFNYLIGVLKATLPQNAPNYNTLKENYPDKKPTITNTTSNPLFTK